MNKVVYGIKNTELDGLTDSLVRAFKADEKAQGNSFLSANMAALEEQSALITTAILQDKALSTLDEADSKRDGAITSLGAVLKGYAAFPIAAKKEAAAPLLAVYEKYSKAGITKAAYIAESSMVESMLGDFAADSLKDHIAALDGVAQAIAAVREAQDAFTAASDAYTKASASKGASASSYKKPILALINDKLVPYLNAMQIADDADIREFAKVAEAEITRVNEAVAKRNGKKSAAGE